MPPLRHAVPLIILCLTTLAGSAAGQERPNIVWLSVEDMSPWIAPYGDTTVPTPNLDRLAEEGVRYTNAFATTPVCAPARAALITGMYPTRIGAAQMRTVSHSKAALEIDPTAFEEIPLYEAVPPAWVRLFPEVLRENGYYCTNNAKTDYQFVAPKGTWDESSGRAHYRNRATGQPFFAVFNNTMTHESRAFPDATRQEVMISPEQVSIPPFYPDTPAVRGAMAQTYDNIAAMDKWLGEHLAELEEEGLLEETIVVFFSDHGVGLPRGKRDLYDTGVRVPLIIRYPDGRGAGTTEDRVVSFVDFGPSMLSLASIEPDPRLDGIPFLGEFAAREREYAFLHADRMDVTHDTQRGITDGRWKYIRNYNPELPLLYPIPYRDQLEMMNDLYALRRTGPRTPEQWQVAGDSRPIEEFYDTRSDPWEITNLAADPEHLARMTRMREAMEAWIRAAPDLGFVLPETVLVEEFLWPPDGEQPTTAEPRIQVESAEEGSVLLTLTCATDGAALAWRLYGEKPWQVYTGPVELAAGGVVEVEAHRIGWKPARAERSLAN